MRRACLAVFAALAALTATATATAQAARPPVPDDYIVVLRPGSNALGHAKRLGLRADRVYDNALSGYESHIPPGQVDRVRGDSRVISVAPVYPLDPVEGRGTTTPGGAKKAQLLPTNLDRIEADLSSAHSGDGTGVLAGPAVATLDTGIDPTQPDLNVRGGVNCSPDGKASTAYADDGGHGTHVAGTIAARDDGYGAVGVAPGVPLYAVKVVATGMGTQNTTANLLCGLDWLKANAAALQIKVVNASVGYTPVFGWSGSDTQSCGVDATTGQVLDPVHEAVCAVVEQGVTLVAATGNDTTDMRGSAPGAFDEVLSVSAMADFNGKPGGGGAPTCSRTYGADDKAATFSNYTTFGNVAPDADWSHAITAPGVCVTSDAWGGGTRVDSGTSMASPAVTGTVALCLASGACASLTPAEIIAKLRADAFAQRSRVPGYGFTGEPATPQADGTPSDPAGSRYYGPLVYAGGY
jgi:subtilisin family serine protease